MTTTTRKTTHEIDATGKSLGRIASEAAKALMGKTSATYTPHVRSNVEVVVRNASKLKIRLRKLESQQYQNYSGFPGGQRVETLRNLSTRKGFGAAVRLAVQRMLPNNTMRVARLKNLHITE